jgi:L-cysteine S-thiosulfotransferase
MRLRKSHFVPAAFVGGILGVLALGAAPAFAAPSEGQKLVGAYCEQCHEVKGIQNFGNIGPSLVDLKARFPDRKDVTAIINDETKRNPLTVMPPFGRNLILTKQEIAVIVDYLYKQ